MKPYMTLQRKMLIAFLEAHPDRQFSVKEIAGSLDSEEISISSLYRNLAALEESGTIIGILREGCRDKYYRCLISEDCRDCIHLTCTKCGKTVHLDHSVSDRLIDSTEQTEEFQISTAKTVIYGICKDCK